MNSDPSIRCNLASLMAQHNPPLSINKMSFDIGADHRTLSRLRDNKAQCVNLSVLARLHETYGWSISDILVNQELGGE